MSRRNSELRLQHLSHVLVRVTIAVIKHRDQKQLEEEKFYLAYNSSSQSIIESGTQAGALRQELLQRPWRHTAYWLAPHCLFSLTSLDTPRSTSPQQAGHSHINH